MSIRDYKDLHIWLKGIEIAKSIYAITDSFPTNELYCLTSQLRKAGISISSNIAEGFMRKHSKEYAYFLSISLGSCAEIETQLIISKSRNYIAESLYNNLIGEIQYEMKMISSLLSKL